MIARRLVVGFLALVGASLGLALDGLGAPAGVAPVVASPAPSASASTGPLPSPPRVEPSVAASPSASPAAGIANFRPSCARSSAQRRQRGPGTDVRGVHARRRTSGRRARHRAQGRSALSRPEAGRLRQALYHLAVNHKRRRRRCLCRPRIRSAGRDLQSASANA